MVIVKNGTAIFSNVTAGIHISNNVEITAGIKPGDTIVTGVLFALSPSPDKEHENLEEFAALNNNEAAK